jgi:hypothetical protein
VKKPFQAHDRRSPASIKSRYRMAETDSIRESVISQWDKYIKSDPDKAEKKPAVILEVLK